VPRARHEVGAGGLTRGRCRGLDIRQVARGRDPGARHEAVASRPGGEIFQALLATIKLLAPGGVPTDKIRPIWFRQKDRPFWAN